jgi:hypothetical protein
MLSVALSFVLGCSFIYSAEILSEEQMPPLLSMESPNSEISNPILLAEEQMPPVLHSIRNV